MKQEAIVMEKKSTLDLKTSSIKLAFAGSVVIIAVAYAFTLFILEAWEHQLSTLVPPTLFLFAGILHVYLLRKSLQFTSFASEWLFTLALAVCIVTAFTLSYMWGQDVSKKLTLASACAFLMPFFFSEMWLAKRELAYEGAKLWTPTTEMLTNYPTFYFRSIPMRIKILQGGGRPAISIKFDVSKEMDLGRIFYDIATNKVTRSGKSVELTDAARHPYQWIFYTSDSVVLNRPLDPARNTTENGLKENDIIYVQRVYGEELSQLTETKN